MPTPPTYHDSKTVARLKKQSPLVGSSPFRSVSIQDYQNFVDLLDRMPPAFYETLTPNSISLLESSLSSIPQSGLPTSKRSWRDTISMLLQRMVNVLQHMREGRPLTWQHGKFFETVATSTSSEASTTGS